jgi:hypothetical protein
MTLRLQSQAISREENPDRRAQRWEPRNLSVLSNAEKRLDLFWHPCRIPRVEQGRDHEDPFLVIFETFCVKISSPYRE